MSKVITPVVGRVVHFWPSRAPNSPKPDQPCAAQIAYVHSDFCINVGYLSHGGTALSASSVQLIQPLDREAPGFVEPDGYFAEWMPYQVGQAQKTEQVVAQLAEAKASAPGAGYVDKASSPGLER